MASYFHDREKKIKKGICERAEQKQPESTTALIHYKTLMCLSFKCVSSWSLYMKFPPCYKLGWNAEMYFSASGIGEKTSSITFSYFCFIYKTLINSSSRKSLDCQQSSSMNGFLMAHTKPTSTLVGFLRDGQIHQKIHKLICWSPFKNDVKKFSSIIDWVFSTSKQFSRIRKIMYAYWIGCPKWCYPGSPVVKAVKLLLLRILSNYEQNPSFPLTTSALSSTTCIKEVSSPSSNLISCAWISLGTADGVIVDRTGAGKGIVHKFNALWSNLRIFYPVFTWKKANHSDLRENMILSIPHFLMAPHVSTTDSAPFSVETQTKVTCWDILQ